MGLLKGLSINHEFSHCDLEVGSGCWNQRDSPATDPGGRGFGIEHKEYFKWEKMDYLINTTSRQLPSH